MINVFHSLLAVLRDDVGIHFKMLWSILYQSFFMDANPTVGFGSH
jgi:hypothetical protein